MNQSQLGRSIEIFKEMLTYGEPVLYSGDSLYIIMTDLYNRIKNLDESQSEELISYWTENVKIYKRKLIEYARNEESFTVYNNKRVPLITEKIAGKIVEYCRSKNPPPPII